MGGTSRLLNWYGGTPVGVWTIKHLVSPWTGGCIGAPVGGWSLPAIPTDPSCC
jgi:hypothetical protein